MELELITKEDLKILKEEIVEGIRQVLKENKPQQAFELTGYKTAQVRDMLGCSYNTLVALRITRKIRTKKIGGALYYNRDDVRKLLEEGF